MSELQDSSYVWIYCPEMDNHHNIATIREGYKEFKRLESYIKERYLGWVACTKLKNAHIMRFMGKMGAQPFEINLEENKIWFKKVC